MAGIDSLLKMLEQQSADTLRLITDEAPRMSKKGLPVRLSFPPITEATLRMLLGDLLTTERDAELAQRHRVEASYSMEGDATVYAVVLQRTGDGAGKLEVTFKRGGARGAAPAAANAPGGTPPPTPAVESKPAPILVSPTPPSRPALQAVPAPIPLRSEATAPPPELLSLLARLEQMGGSDLHLYPGEVPSVRVDGRLRRLDNVVEAEVETLLGGILDAGVRSLLHEGRSVDLAFEVPELGRFRVNVYRARGQVAAAIRLLRRSAPSLEELNFPVPIADLAEARQGLVLVCGPTGSGKSSTLAALARRVVRRGALLITLEDPIEYLLDVETSAGRVRQRQIGTDVRDFPTGLRDALREDPDALLIGEMRDPETIGLALTAAETGHLVLASMHSRSATSSVERIVDSYPPERQRQIRVQLADALHAVVSQRLVPRAQGSGRVPAVEVMRVNHTVGSLIRDGKTEQIPSAIQSSRKEGMVALERCLADQIRAGHISAAEAQAVANEPAALAAYLKG